jgi:hypothetical protein
MTAPHALVFDPMELIGVLVLAALAVAALGLAISGAAVVARRASALVRPRSSDPSARAAG